MERLKIDPFKKTALYPFFRGHYFSNDKMVVVLRGKYFINFLYVVIAEHADSFFLVYLLGILLSMHFQSKKCKILNFLSKLTS